MRLFSKKALLIGLVSLLCLSCLSSCGVTLQSGTNGLYDKKNDISYCHASTVYEAISLVKEYNSKIVEKNEFSPLTQTMKGDIIGIRFAIRPS